MRVLCIHLVKGHAGPPKTWLARPTTGNGLLRRLCTLTLRPCSVDPFMTLTARRDRAYWDFQTPWDTPHAAALPVASATHLLLFPLVTLHGRL